MTAQEYITRLKQLLKRLPHDEYNEAISYYEQYFADGGEVKESPEQVARQILADFATAPIGNDSNRPAKAGTKIWIIILSIFSMPLLLPLGITAISLVFAMFAVIFSLFISGIAIIFGGVLSGIASLILLPISPFTAFFCMGWCCIAIAIGLLFYKYTWIIGKKFSKWILEAFSKILRRNEK
ncbi:MAG: DUF1700 domain-containing protein [Oscillospiraceae bacterium]|nr:DUF1700 domain-containing protein [Oscillospiraceae bacterium]